MLDSRRDGETAAQRDTVTRLGTLRVDVGSCVEVPTQSGGGRVWRSGPSGHAGGQGLATWEGCGAGFSTWLLTWLRGGGSEVSRAFSCWSFFCAEPSCCRSSKNSAYWS